MSKIPFDSISKLRKSLNGAVYDVEYIYGKRIENGGTKYLVKWEGFPSTESSFEPIDNLENVQHFIRGFERKMSDLIFKVALLPNAKKRLPPIDRRQNNAQTNKGLPQQVSNQEQPQRQSSLNTTLQKQNLTPSKDVSREPMDFNRSQQSINQPTNLHQNRSNQLQQLNQKPPSQIRTSSASKGIKSQYQSEIEESEAKKQIAKPIPIQFRDPVLDNELTEKEMGMRAINNEKMKYGNFNNGDIPQCIVKHAPYTRIQKALGKNHTLLLPSSIYFKVEFKPRPSGTVPLSAYISFEEIKDKYPRELLNYYYQNAVLLDPVPQQQQQSQDQPIKS